MESMNITVLGLGAMGRRMAMNLVKAGHRVTVWNRTPEAATELVAAGAKQAMTPAEAATKAEFVISMVRDDEASRQIWLASETGAFAAMKPTAVAMECSTLTPGWVKELGDLAAKNKISLLEAPVSGSRPQAEAAQLIFLVGGDRATLDKSEPLLKVMGSAIHHVGPIGTGALVKLTTNTLLGVQVTALAELIGMLKCAGADVVRALEAVAATPVWSPAAGKNLGLMLSGDDRPLFPVELIEKDLNYTVRVAGTDDTTPTIAAARNVFREAMEQGLGNKNMTAVVRLFEK
jgi:3-hydroxyisobutyrate dehydrogenase